MTTDRRALIRRGLALLSVTAVLYGSATNIANGDGFLSFPAARSLVHDQDLYLDEMVDDLDGAYGLEEARGHAVDFYPWAVALVAVPSVVGLDAAETVGVGPGSAGVIRDRQTDYIQMGNGILATLAAVAAVFALAYSLSGGEADRRRRVATWVAIGFALGTSAWSVTSRANWQHGPSMALTAVALLAAVALERGRPGRGWPLLLGAALMAAYEMRPTNAVLIAALGVWVLVAHGRRSPWVLVGGALAAAPWVAVNRAVWGTTLPPYHDSGRTDLHDELAQAMAAWLVSPSRGLLLFSPIAILAVVGAALALRGRGGHLRPPLAVALVLAFLAQLVVSSSLDDNWWGGVTYGPRLLSDALPWLAALSVPAVAWLLEPSTHRLRRVGRALAGVALLWSVFVHAQGAYLRPAGCWNLDPMVDQDRVWAWSDPQLLAGVRAIGSVPLGSLVTEPCERLDL